MKIIILHGDDSSKSYERLKKFIDTAKARSWEVNFLDETGGSITENISEGSLFESERFFILRDIKKLGKKEIGWIKKKGESIPGNLIIYSDKSLSVTFLKNFPKAVIEEFKLPKIIWLFLEHIVPNNEKLVLTEFHKIIEKDAVELVFSLISKQLCEIYLAKVDPSTKSIPSWKMNKLRSQSSKFSAQKLEELIDELAKIDVDVKTGKADLINSLDLFFLTKLK